MQPLVVAALAALILLSAPPAVLAARLVRDLRGARRPLPTHPRLARLALLLNVERADTPARCRLARLRRDLFESCERALAVVSAGDDPHARWLLAGALRQARRVDDQLRDLWTFAGPAPELLERAALRAGVVRGALERLCEAVWIRAAQGGDQLLGDLVDRVESEHAVRRQVRGLLERRRHSSPPCDISERAAREDGHILRSGAPAPRGEPWQVTSSTATTTASSARSVVSPAASDRAGPAR
ncbi:MAG TPA: hypothetical protein VGL20_02345 [Candidatus Dormibacteraeota bacterium]